MLATLRERLARSRLISPLFKTEAFTRDLENAYLAMFECMRNGLGPEHSDIGLA
jgi:predicted O-linked N-acetylglucosamine transferase (SPINDLY family)